jgi:hypothetical protein
MKTNNSKIEFVKDTFDEYLGKKDYISASDIKNFLKSPKYYHYNKYLKKKKEEAGRHFIVGSALHETILESEKFFENYVIAPKFDKRTSEGKKKYEEFTIQNLGKKILNEDEMDMIVEMGKNAVNNSTLESLIKDSYRELSIYTIDEKTGLKIKLRPDIYCKNFSTITDIKTCLSSSQKDFKSNVYSYGYSITCAFYKDFANRENYVFCAIEKEAPYQISLYQLSDEMETYGRVSYRKALDLMKWSYDNNFWCDYNEFEILCNCYELGNLDEFFELNKLENRITIL